MSEFAHVLSCIVDEINTLITDAPRLRIRQCTLKLFQLNQKKHMRFEVFWTDTHMEVQTIHFQVDWKRKYELCNPDSFDPDLICLEMHEQLQKMSVIPDRLRHDHDYMSPKTEEAVDEVQKSMDAAVRKDRCREIAKKAGRNVGKYMGLKPRARANRYVRYDPFRLW